MKLKKMRQAGAVVAACLDYLAGLIKAGVTSGELDRKAEEFILAQAGRPAFKGYRGFPGSICVSPNEVVIHGIPGQYRLAEGDLVGIDLGVEKDGFFADAAMTFAVGKTDPEKERLLSVTRQALEAAIGEVRPGRQVDDLSRMIENTVTRAGFSAVRSFCGHGIGHALHQRPEIANFVCGNQFRLYPGLGMAIEPMVNYKGAEVRILSDGWTVVTADGSPSAHFEDTVLVTEQGCEIVTRV